MTVGVGNVPVLFSTADVGELTVSWVSGNPASCETCLVRPIICFFSLPSPLNPTCALLVGDCLEYSFVSTELCKPAQRDYLSLPVLSQESFVTAAETG